MKHDDFVAMRHKESHITCLYYLPISDRENYISLRDYFEDEFSPEKFDDYDIIDFEDLDITMLQEILVNILEDENQHTRASYEPRLIADAMKSADIEDYQLREAYRNIIVGFENRFNK